MVQLGGMPQKTPTRSNTFAPKFRFRDGLWRLGSGLTPAACALGVALCSHSPGVEEAGTTTPCVVEGDSGEFSRFARSGREWVRVRV